MLTEVSGIGTVLFQKAEELSLRTTLLHRGPCPTVLLTYALLLL